MNFALLNMEELILMPPIILIKMGGMLLKYQFQDYLLKVIRHRAVLDYAGVLGYEEFGGLLF